jgi:hypothetical protein
MIKAFSYCGADIGKSVGGYEKKIGIPGEEFS